MNFYFILFYFILINAYKTFYIDFFGLSYGSLLLIMNCRSTFGEWNKFNNKSFIRIAIVCIGINLIPLYHEFNKPSKYFTSKTAAYTPK